MGKISYISFAILLCQIPGRAQTADEFFTGDVVHEIRLDVHPRDWAALKQNFQDNTYYPTNFQWRGTYLEGAGIRSRGGGSRTGAKPGLRVDFNRYEAGQEFLGLKSIALDNSAQDASFLKERLSMSLFERMGIPAPRETHAKLFVNGEYVGLYVIIESIDKNFLRTRLGDDEGYLYEYDWLSPYYFEYRGPDAESYSPEPFDPQTHERDPDASALVDFIRTANEASDADFEGAISQFVDLYRLARHLAVENFLAESDGLAGYAGMNNFYLYRPRYSTRFEFFPWDKDITFQAREHSVFFQQDTNVLLRRMMAIPAVHDAYVEELRRTAEVAGAAGGWIDQEIDRLYPLIRDAALSDPNKHCPDQSFTVAPCSNEQFEAEIVRLKEFIQGRAGMVLSALDPRPAEPPPLSPPENEY